MKKLIFLSGLMVMALFFSNCGPSYVSAEPTYIENARPPRPTNTHIWVDGNWVWNRRAHTYVHRNGYWVVPNRGRTYIQTMVLLTLHRVIIDHTLDQKV